MYTDQSSPSQLICDFCGEPEPTWTFAAKDVAMPFDGQSTGGWMACHECARLIVEVKKDALAQRAIDRIAAKYVGILDPDVIETFVPVAHGRFWRARV